MNREFIKSQTAGNVQNSQHKKAKVIKRYGNRKLYDTEQSAYVVLNDIAKMIKNQQEVRVIDNETQDDITSATLTQIIFAAEKKTQYVTPLDALKAIIRKGDGSMSNFFASTGMFKAMPFSPKTIERDRKKVLQSMYQGRHGGEGRGISSSSLRPKSIQERVVDAALDPASMDSTSTILPTQRKPKS